jgi:hypothetical protein
MAVFIAAIGGGRSSATTGLAQGDEADRRPSRSRRTLEVEARRRARTSLASVLQVLALEHVHRDARTCATARSPMAETGVAAGRP